MKYIVIFALVAAVAVHGAMFDRVGKPPSKLHSRPNGTYTAQWETATVMMTDGITLHLDGYRPVPTDNTTRFPVLIFPNSWATPIIEYVVKTLNYAETGYIAIEYETRGWYSSGGQIDCAGPRDLEDASTILSFVLNASTWQPDTSKVAFVGISYGAGIALSMAGYDSRITTAVVLSGWANITKMIMPYNTPNKVWGGLLVLSAQLVGHPPADINDMYNDVMNHRNLTWVRSFCAERSADRFLEAFKKRDVPLFFSHNRLDRLFRAEFALDFFTQLNVTNKFLMMNQGVHAEPELFGLLDIGQNTIWRKARLWLDHFLMGRATNILEQPRVQLQLGDTMTGTDYIGYSDWPSSVVKAQKFVMQPRGGNHFAPLAGPSSTMQSRFRDTADETITYTELPALTAGIPIVTALIRSIGIPYDTAILLAPTYENMIYRSEPFSATTRYCGNPTITFAVSSNMPNWQVYGFLYDVDELDVAYLVSNVYYTQYGNGTVTPPTVLKDLEFHTICRDFPAGHRLAVGFVLYSSLFEPAQRDSSFTVTFHYDAVTPTLTMPFNPV